MVGPRAAAIPILREVLREWAFGRSEVTFLLRSFPPSPPIELLLFFTKFG